MSDLAEQLAEREARRAERLKANDDKRVAQKMKDLDVLERLEEELGAGRVNYVEVESYVEGFPVLVIVKRPGKTLFKRYSDRCSELTPEGKLDASKVTRANEELGASSVLHPTKEELAKLEEELPGITMAAGGCAALMCGAKAQKGKG